MIKVILLIPGHRGFYYRKCIFEVWNRWNGLWLMEIFICTMYVAISKGKPLTP